MQCAIIGAGGTGGTLAAYLTAGGADVTLIARGRHLAAIQENGLTIDRTWLAPEADELLTVPVRAMTAEDYQASCAARKPDVVFICVKSYSLDSVVPILENITDSHTVVIPILNVYGTGAKLQARLPGCLVTDGCIYVSAGIQSPGRLFQTGSILRVVYGVREAAETRPELEAIRDELNGCGITAVLSDNIRRDALEKFSYVSPIGIAGLYYGAKAGGFQREGKERELFKAMIREVSALAGAMGIELDKGLVDKNLKILSTLSPDSTTSMQRDIAEGRPSELDGLLFEVLRMAEEHGVDLPNYRMVSEKLSQYL